MNSEWRVQVVLSEVQICISGIYPLTRIDVSGSWLFFIIISNISIFNTTHFSAKSHIFNVFLVTSSVTDSEHDIISYLL